MVDHIRKESVRARYTPTQEVPAELLEAVATNDPDAEQRLMVWQDLDAVKAAMNELPEECSAAFYLSAVEGLTYAQIGECLGVSERAVAKRIAKTLKHCRASREQR